MVQTLVLHTLNVIAVLGFNTCTTDAPSIIIASAKRNSIVFEQI